MVNPEPLDLKKLRKELSNPYFLEYLVEESIMKKVRQRIKSACEFYLRYKNHPELLVLEHEEYIDELLEKKLIKQKLAKQGLIVYNEKYNEWLFRLAFKDILGDKQ